MKIETLKEKAREHEQREEWSQAMALYARALEKASEQDDTDIALHNRMGDLQVRVGDVEGAVESYETAIDLYLEADLANNAMAVCRKLERNAPNRPEILLRMGQIRVRQGFVVDARQDFLGYAELQLAAGDVDEALRALEEFTTLAPADVDTRLFLAAQLERADRGDDAVEHFRQAYRILDREGRQDEAEAVRARVAELDPEADLDAVPSELEEVGEAPGGGGLAGFEATALTGLELDDPSGTDEAREADTPARPEPAPAESEAAPDVGDVEEDDAVVALEGAVFDLDDDAEASGPAEPPDPGALEATPLDDTPGDSPLDDEWDDDEAVTDLPLLEDPATDEVEEPAAAEALVGDPGPSGSSGLDDSLDELRARTEREPDDADAWRRLGVALFRQDEEGGARDALERAHRAYDAAGDPERAMRVVRELIFHEPEEIAHYQRLVEYASRTEDRALLVPAFLELAEALARTGAPRKAEAVFGQVLALDPRNPRAREALASGVPSRAGARAGRGGAFVDLGDMVLDEPKEDAFRWKVSDADPSGDEEADFARMLSQFKEKVARNMPSDDATAHYDLGAAYKDMGLLDEAVAQFQHALRAHPTHLAAYEMVGQCFLEKGEPAAAVRTLQRALDVEHQVEDELLGIYYYLGQAHEAVGNQERAREFYERVFSLDINFGDVTERLRALR